MLEPKGYGRTARGAHPVVCAASWSSCGQVVPLRSIAFALQCAAWGLDLQKKAVRPVKWRWLPAWCHWSPCLQLHRLSCRQWSPDCVVSQPPPHVEVSVGGTGAALGVGGGVSGAPGEMGILDPTMRSRGGGGGDGAVAGMAQWLNGACVVSGARGGCPAKSGGGVNTRFGGCVLGEVGAREPSRWVGRQPSLESVGLDFGAVAQEVAEEAREAAAGSAACHPVAVRGVKVAAADGRVSVPRLRLLGLVVSRGPSGAPSMCCNRILTSPVGRPSASQAWYSAMPEYLIPVPMARAYDWRLLGLYAGSGTR